MSAGELIPRISMNFPVWMWNSWKTVAIVALPARGYSLGLNGSPSPNDFGSLWPARFSTHRLKPDPEFFLSEFFSMSYSQLFEHDQQFMRLVRRETDVDLVTAALEIARDGQTDLMFEPTRVRLQRSVARLTHPVTQAGSDVEELKLLVRYMTEELNLRGDDDCFAEPDASYLNRVLETGRGIPISLSLIYLNIANELGIPLEPIAAPSHFLTRLQTDSGNLYVDAFDHGRIMDEAECLEWLHGITELPVAEIRRSFKPVDERTIMIRMLNNLKALFGNQEMWVSAWRVQCRLSMLIPGSYRERRDHAILTLRAGRPGEAMDLLQSCLNVCPADERPVLNQHLTQAKRDVPNCN